MAGVRLFDNSLLAHRHADSVDSRPLGCPGTGRYYYKVTHWTDALGPDEPIGNRGPQTESTRILPAPAAISVAGLTAMHVTAGDRADKGLQDHLLDADLPSDDDTR